MGGALPRAVESTIVERHDNKGFQVGVCEMNGWRADMEDAHLIYICTDWAFFGVFDGHGGDACANFVAPRLKKELDDCGCPKDDEAVRKMLYAIDEEFRERDEEGGSTATMCMVHKPTEKGAKHQLRTINAGDSRVLLGQRNGKITDGGGTDGGLTTDHKPDDPTERERIEGAGESVVFTFGNVARVSGNLAVCRGFGDMKYKSRDQKPEERAVTVDPDIKRFECDETDFVILVCDGVSEGDFSNAQVVELVAQVYEKTKDPGAAARAVCHKAVETNSKDNISCMVVALDGQGCSEKPTIEFRPGSTTKIGDASYKKAYKQMAERAGFTVPQAVEKRYEMLKPMFESESSLSVSDVVDKIGSCQETEDGKPNLDDLRQELESLVKLEPEKHEAGSKERLEIFEEFVENCHGMD